jgi:hypothetical protein
MSCDTCNNVDPCAESNYDNCGCINPNTFKCTTYTGTELTALGVLNNDEGDTVLNKVNIAVQDLKDNEGKVKADDSDTCPASLLDKVEAGLNISLSIVGTGCDKKLKIDSTVGGVPVDVKVKATSADTTNGYLTEKLTNGTFLSKIIVNPGADEKVKFDVVPSSLISNDDGNQLTLGDDGKLKTSYTAPDGSETKIVAGTGINKSGTGTTLDPYILSTNPSIQIARSCFDGTWKDLTLIATGNANVVFVSGQPKYRYRFDGSVEFKGSATYTVSFGNYQSSNKEFEITLGSLPTTCITLTELAGSEDLKGVNYIDTPQASADQTVQQYGYIVRRAAEKLKLKLQSAFTSSTSKTVVVNFTGVVIHPNF